MKTMPLPYVYTKPFKEKLRYASRVNFLCQMNVYFLLLSVLELLDYGDMKRTIM